MRFSLLFTVSILFFLSSASFAQTPMDVKNMSKEDLMELSYNDLLDLPFEDLLLVAGKFGLSSDELVEFFLNKDLSISSKKSESWMNSPLSATVLTRDQIEKSGATNLAEALRLIPGMIVREKTPGNFDIHIRGNDNVPPGNLFLFSENWTTLVMIDGRPVYFYAFGGTFWESFPVDIIDIDRIEVVRGPSSAMYGSNALSGVINIITIKPELKKWKFDSDVQYGNLNSKIASASISKGIGKNLKFRISSNLQYRERFMEEAYFFPLKGYYSLDYIATENPENLGYFMKPSYNAVIAQKTDTAPDPNAFFPQRNLANYKYGVNMFMDYNKDDLSLNLSAGYQNSESNTSVIDDSNLALARRTNQSEYMNLNAKYKNLNFHVSGNMGTLDLTAGSTAFKWDYKLFASDLEYNFSPVKNLTISPGISYQYSIYGDDKYRTYFKFYNGDSSLESLVRKPADIQDIGTSLRADYTIFKKLRLIAALRYEKFKAPEDGYLSYTFAGHYTINKLHIVRASYSLANRGPFTTDMEMFTRRWRIFPEPSPMPGVLPPYPGFSFIYEGNQDITLATQNIFDVGYRGRFWKFLSLDIDVFRTKMKDIAALMPDSVALWTTPAGQVITVPSKTPGAPNNPVPVFAHLDYENLDLEAFQTGCTFNVNVALNKNIQLGLLGTYQENKIKGYSPVSPEFAIQEMTKSVYIHYLQSGGELIAGVRPDSIEDTKNVSTPTFFGGAVVNFLLMDKININANVYYYSKQKMIAKYGEFDIKPKTILNLKVSYKVYKENSIYLNLRNALNVFGHNDQAEFGFLDKIGTSVFVGCRLNF